MIEKIKSRADKIRDLVPRLKTARNKRKVIEELKLQCAELKILLYALEDAI